ncbi:MAG: tRNA dihydrouridine synthase DusB [Clostridia bacterium]|nr:tRNA dihydrouridine synthase DusB [Clostridia bacterium]
MSLNIGGISLRHGLILAPMAGAADASFRAVCRAQGAEYTVSEMLSAKALCYEQLSRKTADNTHKTANIARITPPEAPCSVQIFGSEPEFMARAAALLASGEYRGADDGRLLPVAIDINMGCPVHKVVSNGEGSALMKNLPLAGEIIRAVRDAVKIPLTVKFRAGWDADHINAPELARIAEANGADAICIHARTREQMYAPGVDISIIGEVKRAIKIPVIGNGDIFSADDAVRMITQTGCDGVAVARGALGNPWLFREIAFALDGIPYVPPTDAERLELALAHARDMIARKGERVGLAEARPHMARYTKGIHGSAVARDAIMKAESLDIIEEIFSGLCP